MEERKQRWLKGSFTVEMAFLMPMILFLIMYKDIFLLS